MSLCSTVGYNWVTVMDGVQFEFKYIKPLNTKNDSERKINLSAGAPFGGVLDLPWHPYLFSVSNWPGLKFTITPIGDGLCLKIKIYYLL